MNTLEVEKALELIDRASEEGYKAYKVQASECGHCWAKIVVFPRPAKLDGSDWEFVYSLFENGDEWTKLDVGNSMYFQPTRDDSNSKGIITRIL